MNDFVQSFHVFANIRLNPLNSRFPDGKYISNSIVRLMARGDRPLTVCRNYFNTIVGRLLFFASVGKRFSKPVKKKPLTNISIDEIQ